MQKDIYILKKDVDWSVLNYGFSIPITFQFDFYNQIKKNLHHGEKLQISLILNNKEYEANLINQPFSKTKYPRHKDILQIRYSKEICNELKLIFHKTLEYLNIERKNKSPNDRTLIKVSDELKESIIIYGTDIINKFLINTITINDKNDINLNIEKMNIKEDEIELFFNKTDKSTGFYKSEKIVKIRKLNRAISESLKLLYDFKCQICGKNISKPYDVNIVESHHIESFIKSLNNDADNILIVCPNHHRIIHRSNPEFERNRLLFQYPNGLEEKLLLNKHL